MPETSRFLAGAVLAALAACGGTPHAPPVAPAPAPAPVTGPRIAAPDDAPRPPDPDLDRPPPKKLLAIDWATVPLATPADALAVWAQIAPTGADWEAKLDEVPAAAARPLAIALLQGGRFTCAQPQPPSDCAVPVFDVAPPAPAATDADPCLRRILAMWAISQLEVTDLSKVMDALRAIASIPPPEGELVATALRAIPDWDQAARLELMALASAAGQRDVVDALMGRLDEAHLIEAVTRHHIAGALVVLSAEGHRAVYLGAITDEALPAAARIEAIRDLVALDRDPDQPEPDLRAALIKAAGARDCAVAGAAARALQQQGEPRLMPVRPRTRTPATMMRALCVLASYEPLQDADEDSLLVTFVPPGGLERITVEYDALSERDPDGDGDPHTRRSVDLVPRSGLVLPEVADLARAMQRCQGTTCTSPDREFRFGFGLRGGELWLTKLEVIERPPCTRP